MDRQRQLPVNDNTEVSSGVRNSDASAEHQDVVAVYPVHELIRALLLTVSCFSKIQIGFTFLVPAHPGSPEQRAKGVCVCVCVMTQHGVARI